jgi:hypothetical protein
MSTDSLTCGSPFLVSMFITTCVLASLAPYAVVIKTKLDGTYDPTVTGWSVIFLFPYVGAGLLVALFLWALWALACKNTTASVMFLAAFFWLLIPIGNFLYHIHIKNRQDSP